MRGRATAPKAAKLISWNRTGAITLPADAPLDQIIATVIRACRDHWSTNVAAAIDGSDPEGVHQVRVALRRLRAAFGLFKHLLPATQRAALAREAKWLLSELGPVRDLDVFIHVLAADFAPRVVDDEGFAQLIRAARVQRDAAQAAAAAALGGARAKRFGMRLDLWLQGRGWRLEKSEEKATEDAGCFARHAINRRLRKIKAAAKEIDRLPTSERHELRIAVKKARYGIAFFHALLPAKRAARWTASLKHMQESLGHLNDLDVAERTIARLVGEYVAGETATTDGKAAAGRSVRRLHRKAVADAEPDIRKQGRRLARIALF